MRSPEHIEHSAKMHCIVAIDPGTEESAIVQTWSGAPPKVTNAHILPNGELLEYLDTLAALTGGDAAPSLAVEMVSSYGMPVGRDVFETVLWTGRFIERWSGCFQLVYRRDVKLHLCGTARAKDANIRQAILDRYPRTGGGSTPQVGTKKDPGPLYGFKSHLWSALAVALTAHNRGAQ